MPSPFLRDALEEEAASLHGELHARQQIILKSGLGVSFFLAITYLFNFIHSHMTNVTHCGCDIPAEQNVVSPLSEKPSKTSCVALEMKAASPPSRNVKEIIHILFGVIYFLPMCVCCVHCLKLSLVVVSRPIQKPLGWVPTKPPKSLKWQEGCSTPHPEPSHQ